jgi:hypothetical protein
MSSSEEDERYMERFVKSKVLTNAKVDNSKKVDDVKLMKSQRKTAREERYHVQAVTKLVDRHNLARNLAMSGVEALKQAESRSDIQISTSIPSNEVDTMSPIEAYNAAIAAENKNDPINVIVSRWQLLYLISDKVVKTAGPGTSDDVNSAKKLKLTALARQARHLEAKGLVKQAITMIQKELGELKACSSLFSKSALKSSYISELLYLANLYSSVGNMESASSCLLQVSSLKKSKTLKPENATSNNVTLPTSQVESTRDKTHSFANVLAPYISESAITSLNKENKRQTMLISTLASLFNRNSLLELDALLNRALLQDHDAIQMIMNEKVPTLNASLLLSVTAYGHDLVIQTKRILGFLSKSKLSAICTEKDSLGSNSLEYAASTGSIRVLDEMLKAVFPFILGAASSRETLIAVLGLSEIKLQQYPLHIKSCINAFLEDPQKYIAEWQIVPSSSVMNGQVPVRPSNSSDAVKQLLQQTDSFKTDKQISSTDPVTSASRELQQMKLQDNASPVIALTLDEESRNNPGKWDQFQSFAQFNEGRAAVFDENEYTSKLDMAKFSAAQIAEASALAESILSKGVTEEESVEGKTEEELFSAVA